MIFFDIETGPQDGILGSKFAPGNEAFDHRPFDPASVKRLKKDTDASYAERVQEAHEAYVLKAAEKAGKHHADTEEKREEFLDSACLFAHLGRVLVIGVLEGNDFRAIEGDERKILEEFWDLFRESSKRAKEMVGHNILGFDLPFIVRRSWSLGVKVPTDAVVVKGRYTNWHPLFQDTATLWLLGQYSRDTKWSLDAVGHCLGSGGKIVESVSGKGWWRTYATDKPRAMAYLENDCRQTKGIYAVMAPPSTRV